MIRVDVHSSWYARCCVFVVALSWIFISIVLMMYRWVFEVFEIRIAEVQAFPSLVLLSFHWGECFSFTEQSVSKRITCYHWGWVEFSWIFFHHSWRSVFAFVSFHMLMSLHPNGRTDVLFDLDMLLSSLQILLNTSWKCMTSVVLNWYSSGFAFVRERLGFPVLWDSLFFFSRIFGMFSIAFQWKFKCWVICCYGKVLSTMTNRFNIYLNNFLVVLTGLLKRSINLVEISHLFSRAFFGFLFSILNPLHHRVHWRLFTE